LTQNETPVLLQSLLPLLHWHRAKKRAKAHKVGQALAEMFEEGQGESVLLEGLPGGAFAVRVSE